jgi:hypothetical protein
MFTRDLIQTGPSIPRKRDEISNHSDGLSRKAACPGVTEQAD